MSIFAQPMTYMLAALGLPEAAIEALNFRCMALYDALVEHGWHGTIVRVDMQGENPAPGAKNYLFLCDAGDLRNGKGETPAQMLDGRYPHLLGRQTLWPKGTQMDMSRCDALRIFSGYMLEYPRVRAAVQRWVLAQGEPTNHSGRALRL